MLIYKQFVYFLAKSSGFFTIIIGFIRDIITLYNVFCVWKVHLADSFSLSRQKTLLPFTFTNDMTAILISERRCTC